MGKSKGLAGSHLIPMPPVIYIHDVSLKATVAESLSELIPNAVVVRLGTSPEKFLTKHAKDRKKLRCTNPVYIFVDNSATTGQSSQKTAAQNLRQCAIKIGCNFASVNTYFEADRAPTAWGGNHLNLLMPKASIDSSNVDGKACAEKIYKWLFTVLTIKDTLHLIPDEQMRENNENFPVDQYKYCTVADSLDQKKDSKIYLIAMIVTKPEVVSDNLIAWQVADKTGLASCEFKYYGAACAASWDWILTLQPGQRRSLPLMRSVLVKEKPLMTLVKAPLRIPGMFLQGAGLTVAFAGALVSVLGEEMRMGKRKQWVLEHDLTEHVAKHKGVKIVPSSEVTSSIKVFSEKGDKTWDNETWDKESTSNSTLTDDSVTEKVELLYEKFDSKLG